MLIHAAQDKKSPCIASSQIVKVKLFSKKMIEIEKNEKNDDEYIIPTSKKLYFGRFEICERVLIRTNH